MLELGLKPVPSAEWQAEWDELMQDPWLRHKTDRERRLREHFAYCQKYLPMLATGGAGYVVDIGPGCGETLEIARAMRGLGRGVIGIDSPDGALGMGSPYVRACRLMHERQQLVVYYQPLLEMLSPQHEDWRRCIPCIAINMRGSIEQVFACHMDGEPHDVHHDCKRLAWRMDDACRADIRLVLTEFYKMLLPGGVVMIAANGAANVDEYDREMISAAFAVGLNVDLHEPPTILRLRKP